MHTLRPTFRVGSETALRSLDGQRLAEFQIDEANDIVLHKPTQLRFALEYDKTLERLRISDLGARLYTNDPKVLPPVQELRLLAVEAIQIFMMFSEVCVLRSAPLPRVLWLQPEPGDDSYGLPF